VPPGGIAARQVKTRRDTDLQSIFGASYRGYFPYFGSSLF
jgi:hypothetical protein